MQVYRGIILEPVAVLSSCLFWNQQLNTSFWHYLELVCSKDTYCFAKADTNIYEYRDRQMNRAQIQLI